MEGLSKLKKHNFIENFSSKFITWFMIVVMLFLTVVSLLFRSYIDVTYQEIIYYRKDNVLLAVLFLAATIAIVWWGKKKGILDKIPEKPLFFLLMVYVACVSGIWAYASHSFPTADQASILKCVDGLIHGNYECMEPMSPHGYLQYNRHQVGLTAFYEVFTRIFTGGQVNYQAVYVLNVLMIMGIFWGLYLVTRQLTNRKEIITLELLLSFGMFQLMLYSTFVYGLIPGLFFDVFGIYFMLKLMKSKRWYDGCLMALMCALAIIMKSNYLVFLIAVGITLVIKSISERYPVYLLYLLLAVAGFLGINAAAQKTYENRTGIEFGDTIPNTAYLAMGMQEGAMAPGWFNGFNHVTYRMNDYNEKVTDQISRAYIKERLQEFAGDPLECLKFYYYKIISQWNEVTYECFWISTNEGNHTRKLSLVVESLYTGRLHTAAEAAMNLYQLLMFAGTLLCAWSLRKNGDISKVICLLCILGGFLFHILWEGKSQYLISYFPLMLPCAAWGMTTLTDYFKKKKGNVSTNEFCAE